MGKCGGRKSYAEAKPEVVALAKELRDQRMSLRKISVALAARGHVTAGGKPYAQALFRQCSDSVQGVRQSAFDGSRQHLGASA
jgi:hypothetical protein